VWVSGCNTVKPSGRYYQNLDHVCFHPPPLLLLLLLLWVILLLLALQPLYLDLGCDCSLLIQYSLDRTTWTGVHLTRPLPTHRTTQKQTPIRCMQISKSRVGLEPTAAEFERAKTVHALNCVNGNHCLCNSLFSAHTVNLCHTPWDGGTW
jgi:hypothetical protein